MVLLSSLVALVAMSGPADNESLLAKIIPIPTGKNGYEDYLRACDLIGTDQWGKYDAWLSYKARAATSGTVDSDEDNPLPPLPPGVTPGMSDLTIRRVANEHLGGAFDLVLLGNTKQVYDPRESYSYSTLFPEMARFKTLAKIGINRAYVEFADGRTTQAVKDLLEGVKFSRNTFGSTIIASLVSIATQAIFLAEFNRHLGQLSLSDAQLIDRTCKSLIENPYPLADMFKPEYQMAVNSMDLLFEQPDLAMTEDDEKVFGKALAGLNSADRQICKSLVIKALGSRRGDIGSRLAGPESGWPLRESWTDPPASLEDMSVSNLALVVANHLEGKDTERQVARAIGRGRIQLRLLQLHAKVIAFHWQNNKWPTRIQEFADRNTAFDPFTREEFHYEVKDGTYRLYSTGIPGLGQIELKYRVQQGQQASDIDHPRL